ncbi:ATPase [Skermania sp. ID1734]|uniref:SRPBCC family protein n=1 Tax=Skermania sp. ID1734 TaxID=2597516 RepID=UPI00118081A4|nr:SRPBCC family protein [Skermania sp. ID1734]TSE00728.1 ATPase [Skermania sp. ID1734]
MSSQPATTRHGSATVELPTDTEILITRAFDAPAANVFKALTTPVLIKRWWGFDTSEWKVCEVDLRVGGRWRFVAVDGGMEVGFHGEFKEIDAPHRIVQTEAYEGVPDPDGAAGLNVTTLDEVDGVTTMRVLARYPSREIRDAIIQSGMESGMQVSYNRLEDVLREG